VSATVQPLPQPAQTHTAPGQGSGVASVWEQLGAIERRSERPAAPTLLPTITRHDPTRPLHWTDASRVGQRNSRSDQHRHVVSELVHQLHVVDVAVRGRDREPLDELARATTDHAPAIAAANDIRVGSPLIAVRVVTNDQPEQVRLPVRTGRGRMRISTRCIPITPPKQRGRSPGQSETRTGTASVCPPIRNATAPRALPAAVQRAASQRRRAGIDRMTSDLGKTSYARVDGVACLCRCGMTSGNVFTEFAPARQVPGQAFARAQEGGNHPLDLKRVLCGKEAAMAAKTDVRPFNIEFPEADLEDLRTRIRATRWPGPGPT